MVKFSLFDFILIKADVTYKHTEKKITWLLRNKKFY